MEYYNMPGFEDLKAKLLKKRQEDLDAEAMGEMPSPTALAGVSEFAAERAGERLDEVGKQQKTLSAQAWDRASAPVGPQLPDVTPEELARSKETSSGVMGSMAPYVPTASKLQNIRNVAKGNEVEALKALGEAKANSLDQALLHHNQATKSSLTDVNKLPEKYYREINEAFAPFYKETSPQRNSIVDDTNAYFKALRQPNPLDAHKINNPDLAQLFDQLPAGTDKAKFIKDFAGPEGNFPTLRKKLEEFRASNK